MSQTQQRQQQNIDRNLLLDNFHGVTLLRGPNENPFAI